ncbi:MAG: cobyric acid synthase [Cellvibrionaceae bacterium]|nr:cobyric acid synthase [Cellvibrionaceae bacterium]
MPGMLMVQGCTSDAGKSTLVAALCRILANKQFSVAPFKPQNMALNSAVTEEGGEIGRAQALQAQACKINSSVHMNPVLLKPASDIGAQIIVQGKVLGNMNADTYHQYKPQAKTAVFDSFKQLQNRYQHIIIEGAGSPAEINLRQNDIANMGFAEPLNCPVILVADIDKGGVFAHLVGTLELLSPTERALIKGFVINKFRGDIRLLQPGLNWLEQRTGLPVIGVLPYFPEMYLDAEDAIDTRQMNSANANMFKVQVPVLPRISNHTDFDPLRLHPQIDLQFVAIDQPPAPCDLIILPGSKNVRQDLSALKNSPWCQAIDKHLRYGGKLLGICGGLQMLGTHIEDPLGLEGLPGSAEGLGYLPLTSTLAKQKMLKRVQTTLHLNAERYPVEAYEIHHGNSHSSAALHNPLSSPQNQGQAFLSQDQQILGTYLHGLMDTREAFTGVLKWAGAELEPPVDLRLQREQQLDRLAAASEQHLDLGHIFNCLNIAVASTQG